MVPLPALVAFAAALSTAAHAGDNAGARIASSLRQPLLARDAAAASATAVGVRPDAIVADRAQGPSLAAVSDDLGTALDQVEADRSLLVCNAYVWRGLPLDVYRVRSLKRLTNLRSIGYKECQQFTVALKDGDQIDFKAGDLDVGTFYATGLPLPQSPEAALAAPATLLLVARRRDEESAAVAFESHAFAALRSAQVAVVDAYSGKTAADTVIRIMDAGDGEGAANSSARSGSGATFIEVQQDQHRREEDLRYNSVIAVNPGSYQVALTEINASATSVVPSMSLMVAIGGRYVVMRVGDAASGVAPTTAPGAVGAFPQELVIFPSLSAAAGLCARAALAFAALAAGIFREF